MDSKGAQNGSPDASVLKDGGAMGPSPEQTQTAGRVSRLMPVSMTPEQLAQWRGACETANDWDREANRQLKSEQKADRKRIRELERELHRKEKALAEAAALMVLRKKADAIWGEPEGE